VNGPTREAIEAGPYLEAFRAKDYEVLFTLSPLDDYVLEGLMEFEGKKLIAAEQDTEDLPKVEASTEGVPEPEREELLAWFKEVLGENVTEVRVSSRLTDSPAISLTTYGTHGMQRMMQAMDRGGTAGDIPAGILELNCSHPIIVSINDLRKEADPFAAEAAEQVLQNVRLAAGLISDPRTVVSRLYSVLERALKK
jgi:molecular chaperone HtpG